MTIELIPVSGLPEVQAGDDLARLITDQARIETNDVVVIASKVMAKAEGRVVACRRDDPEARERLIVSESVRILRRRGTLLITETPHGFICANAGIDWSNVHPGHAVLLPKDPDRSARLMRDRIRAETGSEVGIVISDTFGRAWRRGVVDVALGSAGITPVLDLRGEDDGYGNVLTVTEVCIADELAGAAELAMGKTSRNPAVIIRGVPAEWLRSGSSIQASVVRKAGEDLFR